MAASCRTGREDRTQLNDASLSGGPIAKTGAAFGSVRKSFKGLSHRVNYLEPPGVVAAEPLASSSHATGWFAAQRIRRPAHTPSQRIAVAASSSGGTLPWRVLGPPVGRTRPQRYLSRYTSAYYRTAPWTR